MSPQVRATVSHSSDSTALGCAVVWATRLWQDHGTVTGCRVCCYSSLTHTLTHAYTQQLAAAVARECGLRFISVKGPEVLDKYIGASEQAVSASCHPLPLAVSKGPCAAHTVHVCMCVIPHQIRDLFAQAAAAAPAVLFFDEVQGLS